MSASRSHVLLICGLLFVWLTSQVEATVFVDVFLEVRGFLTRRNTLITHFFREDHISDEAYAVLPYDSGTRKALAGTSLRKPCVGTAAPFYRTRLWTGTTNDGTHTYLDDVWKLARWNLTCEEVLLTTSPDEWVADVEFLDTSNMNRSIDARCVMSNRAWAQAHKVCHVNVGASCQPASTYKQPLKFETKASELLRMMKFQTRWFTLHEIHRTASHIFPKAKWFWHVDTDLLIANKNASISTILRRIDRAMKRNDALINPGLYTGSISDVALVATTDMQTHKTSYFVNGGSIFFRAATDSDLPESPVTKFILEAMISLANYTSELRPELGYEFDDQGKLSWLLEVAFNVTKTGSPHFQNLRKYYDDVVWQHKEPTLDVNKTLSVAEQRKAAVETLRANQTWYDPWHEACSEDRLVGIGKFDYDKAFANEWLRPALLRAIPDRVSIQDMPDKVVIVCSRWMNSPASLFARRAAESPLWSETNMYSCGDIAAHFIGPWKATDFVTPDVLDTWCSELLPVPEILNLK